ncbi:MAG: hypothetical protein AW10_03832 [Candidatus Accumulibacter appositus]|uniref:Uncharacterized protein n=1 Tax=Candidatus Accumulibacter appositus TaxID=1454003 RepID=A0A011PK23_9PROT|nr:hypothetical protein [Accumulibacter sp.]EXI77387.1 MAG: hypothetical protein AW10_03832 [Candidatus Accumulibacter appositus]HRF06783.1 hypothetical protein [Accumulibacter sp.]
MNSNEPDDLRALAGDARVHATGQHADNGIGRQRCAITTLLPVRRPTWRFCVPLLALVLSSIGSASIPTYAAEAALQKYPDVLAAKVRAGGDDRFDFDVTVSSPYDSPQRYADAFRVMSKEGSEGTVYGERTLFHDHASEQPFTRDLYGVRIPPGVSRVVIQGRDKQFGYGGKTLEATLPGR